MRPCIYDCSNSAKKPCVITRKHLSIVIIFRFYNTFFIVVFTTRKSRVEGLFSRQKKKNKKQEKK